MPGHSLEFVEAAASEEGVKAAISAAKALAMTVIDLFTEPKLMERVKREFIETKKKLLMPKKLHIYLGL